ncbi:MAG: hypothetical protein JWR54_3844 [Mucilaginibacter sp.]|nr:hypothetical protein [Mucilaginibacter sp.]
MSKIIIVNKSTTQHNLAKELAKLPNKRYVDLDKYFGKINFGVDGLDYQLKIRGG